MGCGSKTGGHPLDDVDLENQSVIQGTVVRDGRPVDGAYVRLLDRTGEFVAEVPTSEDGTFRFFAAPGHWTLRTLAPRTASVDRAVVAREGSIAEVTVAL